MTTAEGYLFLGDCCFLILRTINAPICNVFEEGVYMILKGKRVEYPPPTPPQGRGEES